MNGISIIIGAVLAAAILLAVRAILRQREKGCCGSCAGCPHGCTGRRQ